MLFRSEKKVYSGTTLTQHTRFVYDGFKLTEELNVLSSNAVLRRYSWQPEAVGLDVPLSVFDASANASYSYATDANKNIAELTDASGNVIAHYEYSPFGQQTKATGSYAGSNPFRFSSEYYDAETGLVYYNYRYYDATLGRWLSRDPIGESGGYSLYYNYRYYDAQLGGWLSRNSIGKDNNDNDTYYFIKNRAVSYYDYLGLHGGVPGSGISPSNPTVSANFAAALKRILLCTRQWQRYYACVKEKKGCCQQPNCQNNPNDCGEVCQEIWGRVHSALMHKCVERCCLREGFNAIEIPKIEKIKEIMKNMRAK